MPKSKTYIALDVGEKRIGVAVGDDSVRIAVPFETIDVDGGEVEAISEIVIKENAETVVVGYPRNQSGEPTAQTQFVVDFADKLSDVAPNIVFQDESLTSVIAEKRLESYNRPYQKSDIDAQAAAIILQDYLEQLP
ncbi:MAG TPA: Holliday junction resolvase RuvX [Candidatus Saccharibacteria bacterium]|nr:Holliday junction resolvase RuvX [Candidatus Saccharibacteria bacterium]HRQ98325.1 Holliday junction resolvase RuvX [Candidatus Saccharibacteria bacterium]